LAEVRLAQVIQSIIGASNTKCGCYASIIEGIQSKRTNGA